MKLAGELTVTAKLAGGWTHPTKISFGVSKSLLLYERSSLYFPLLRVRYPSPSVGIMNQLFRGWGAQDSGFAQLVVRTCIPPLYGAARPLDPPSDGAFSLLSRYDFHIPMMGSPRESSVIPAMLLVPLPQGHSNMTTERGLTHPRVIEGSRFLRWSFQTVPCAIHIPRCPLSIHRLCDMCTHAQLQTIPNSERVRPNNLSNFVQLLGNRTPPDRPTASLISSEPGEAVSKSMVTARHSNVEMVFTTQGSLGSLHHSCHENSDDRRPSSLYPTIIS